MKRGEPNLPPADLATRELADHIVQASGSYRRLSHRLAPLVDWSDDGDARFSHPSLPFKVLYLARRKETCFWERFGHELRDQPPRARGLSSRLLAERVWKSFSIAPDVPVRCLDLRNAGTLRRLGADAATFMAPYAITQAWAGALMAHPAGIDALLYRSRLDSAESCLAIFGRPEFTRDPGAFGAAVERVHPIADPDLMVLLATERIALLAPSP